MEDQKKRSAFMEEYWANSLVKIQDSIDLQVKQHCDRYGIIETKTETKQVGPYLFAVTHTKIETAKGMHVYGLYCFHLERNNMLLYRAGNVIDGDKFITIQEVMDRTLNNFRHTAKELEELLSN